MLSTSSQFRWEEAGSCWVLTRRKKMRLYQGVDQRGTAQTRDLSDLDFDIGEEGLPAL